jgi:hypothetical protein
MTRERSGHAVDWRPATLACVLYAVLLAAVVWFDVLPWARGLLEAVPS